MSVVERVTGREAVSSRGGIRGARFPVILKGRLKPGEPVAWFFGVAGLVILIGPLLFGIWQVGIGERFGPVPSFWIGADLHASLDGHTCRILDDLVDSEWEQIGVLDNRTRIWAGARRSETVRILVERDGAVVGLLTEDPGCRITMRRARQSP